MSSDWEFGWNPGLPSGPLKSGAVVGSSTQDYLTSHPEYLRSSAPEEPPTAAESTETDHDPIIRRLVRFYKKYNPAKATSDNIVSVIKQYEGKYEALFNVLVKKYGPEPPEHFGGDWQLKNLSLTLRQHSARHPELFRVVATVPLETPENLRQMLMDAASGRCPPQEIDKIVDNVEKARFVPTVDSLSQARIQHSARLRVVDLGSLSDTGCANLVSTLVLPFSVAKELIGATVAFVDNADGVDTIELEEFAFPSAVPRKFHVSPEDENLANRLALFYAKHNPSKVDTIESILTGFQGRHEVLIEQLEAKYGDQIPTSVSAVDIATWSADFAMILENCCRSSKLKTLTVQLCGGDRIVTVTPEVLSCFSIASKNLGQVSCKRDTPLSVYFPSTVVIPLNLIGGIPFAGIDATLFALAQTATPVVGGSASAPNVAAGSTGGETAMLALVTADLQEIVPAKRAMAHSALLRGMLVDDVPADGETKMVPLALDRPVAASRLPWLADFVRVVPEATAVESEVDEDFGQSTPLLSHRLLALTQYHLLPAIALCEETNAKGSEANRQPSYFMFQVLFEMMELAIYLNMPSLKRYLRSLVVLACAASVAKS